MKLGTPSELHKRIIETLRLLAADCETQIQAFPEFTFVPDEIVDTFTMTHAFVPQLIDAGVVNDAQTRALDDLDRFFGRVSGPTGDTFWTIDALRTDNRWEQLRTKAAEALKLFGRSKHAPDLYWISYC